MSVEALPSIFPLAVRGLVYEAGGRRLIDDIDLDLAGGGFIAVMGPNGAGKSLLLRLLHGLIEPSAGQVTWGGQPPRRAVRLRQAMVFQRPVLLRRSVAANVAYALSTRGVARRALKARVTEWLERAGLAQLGGRPARVLSGGEQQRLAVARALSTEPDVLFMDEPTTSLDPASILAIENLIAEARAAGTTVLLVTHDAGQVRRLADEVIFLYRGRVEERNSAAVFLSCPRSEKAQAFMDGRIVL